MSKEKAPAFQMYAAEILADSNVIPMTMEEFGCYMQLLLVCWRETTLPADIEELTGICKGIIPSTKVLRCFVLTDNNLTEQQGGTTIGQAYRHKRLDQERAKQELWRTKSALGGKHSAHKRKHKKELNPQQGGGTLQSSSSSSTSSSIASSSSTAKAKEKSIAASQAKPQDKLYEIFNHEYLKSRDCPYRSSTADFVQMAKLKKALAIDNGSVPSKWLAAVVNYLASPLSKYTLADLCSRYDVFIHGEVDRFGKPAGFNDLRQANKATVTKMAEKGFFDE